MNQSDLIHSLSISVSISISFSNVCLDCGYAISEVGTAARAAASAMADKTTQGKVLASAKGVTNETKQLIEAAGALAANTSDGSLQVSILIELELFSPLIYWIYIR